MNTPVGGSQVYASCEFTHVWVAKHPSAPGYFAAAIDAPGFEEGALELVEEWKLRGGVVSRVAAADALQGLKEYAQWKEPETTDPDFHWQAR